LDKNEKTSPICLANVFKEIVSKYSNKPALASYNKNLQKWEFLTYREMDRSCTLLARGLIKLGIKKRSCIAILSYNRAEWNMTFWTAMLSDLIAFGIYMTNAPQECLHILNDSKSPIVFVEN